MWCKACQQNVPGIASLQEGKFQCARCGAQLARNPRVAQSPHARAVCDEGIELDDGPTADGGSQDTLRLRDWETEDKLGRVERMLRAESVATGIASVRDAADHRFDPPSSSELRIFLPATTDSQHRSRESSAHPSRPVAAPRDVRPPPRLSSLVWLAIGTGLMGLTCGGVLLGWAMATSRADLWNLGLPLTLAANCALVVGLLFALERLWQSGSDQARRLGDLNEHLANLARAESAARASTAAPPEAALAATAYLDYPLRDRLAG